jgi:hypothetical protein
MPDKSTRIIYTDNNEFVDEPGVIYTGSKKPIAITYEPEPGEGGGLLALDVNGVRVPERDIPGKTSIGIEKDANGQFQAINKATGEAIGLPFGAKTDASTDDMKEYVLAKLAAEARGDVYPDFDKWLDTREKSRSEHDSSNVDPATGSEWPNPPAGYNYVRKADGSFDIGANGVPKLAMMEGSEADITAKEKAEAEKLKKAGEETDKTSLTVATELALEALEDEQDGVTSHVTGVTGMAQSVIPGTPASTFAANLKTIQGILSFSRLQTMKDQSKTGGALGNVSNIELQLLASTIASVSQNQDPEVLKRNLEYIRDIFNNKEGAGRKYLDEIYARRAEKRKKRGQTGPDPLAPPPAAPAAPANTPPPGAKLERWDEESQSFVPVN